MRSMQVEVERSKADRQRVRVKAGEPGDETIGSWYGETASVPEEWYVRLPKRGHLVSATEVDTVIAVLQELRFRVGVSKAEQT